MKAQALIAALSLALLVGCTDNEERIDATNDQTLTDSVFSNMESRHEGKLDGAFAVYAERYPNDKDFREALHGKTLDEMIADAEKMSGRTF